MVQQFEHLFRPIQLGPLIIPNRICFSAHAALFAENNLPSEREVYYFGDRAKGGTGLIVIGGSYVHETSNWIGGFHIVSDERAIPGYRRIADAVHEHGAKLMTQIDHYGGLVPYIRDYKGPLLAPSSVPDALEGEAGKEMEPEDMEMILEATAKACWVAKEGGLDGVELLAAQGWGLPNQFLSPVYNKRTDEYGGSLENRLRFPIRLFERIRKEVGKNLCVGIKLVGDEFTPGGLTLEDIKEIAKRLAATGLLDYIHVCCGITNSVHIAFPEMSFPIGFAAYLAAGIREVVNIPVMAVKRINDPVLAEKILAEGQADMIAMARALIADPELPKKAREGRLEDIRQCIGVNQECIDSALRGHAITCIQNPAAGEEKRWGIGTIKPAARRKKMVVVGGGPGGLKAAETAALRGHEVVLYEKGPELGGQILFITRVASRQEFGGIIRHLSIQARKLGAQIHLSREVTADEILAEGADVVVVATGSTPEKTGYSSFRPDVAKLPGADRENVLSVFEVLSGIKPVGKNVVIIDDRSDFEAPMTAEYLGDQGKRVEIVTRFPYVGMKIGQATFDPYMERLTERSVTCTAFTAPIRIEDSTVVFAHVYSKKEYRLEGVDTVVLAMGKRPNQGLYHALKGKVPELHRIGDCVAPRKITDAIYDGNLMGREI